MQRIVLRSNTGLTLVEVIVALVIALLVFLALMQTALVGIDVNMRNVLRDEAVGIAEMRLETMRNIPYTSVVSDTGSLSGYDCPTVFSSVGIPVERNIKNITGFDFCTSMVCTEFGGDGNCATSDADNKQVAVQVGWKWKGENYTHSVTTVRKR
ncbi:MAG: prepilin-type N-terminal cleavage/methylation domain-containing protein [Thermodesulfovibrionales bacterium]